MNSGFSQYLLTLGEFSLDNYTSASEHFSGIEWYLFIAATLFGQLIILNMLIAIMGYTFDKIFENQTQFVLQLKLEVLNDYSFLFSKDRIPNYLYVAKLKDVDEENDGEWGGRIKAMTRQNRSLFEDLKTSILSMMKTGVEHDVGVMDKRQKEMNDKIDQNRKQVEAVREDLRKKMEENQDNLKKKIEKIEEKMEEN